MGHTKSKDSGKWYHLVLGVAVYLVVIMAILDFIQKTMHSLK